MSKQALQNIIEQQNVWRKFRDQSELNIDTLTLADAGDLYESIDMGLELTL